MKHSCLTLLCAAGLIGLPAISFADSTPAMTAAPATRPSADLQTALAAAGMNRPQLEAALAEVPADERPGMEYLIAHLPYRDLATAEKGMLLQNVALAYQAADARPWGKTIPAEVFDNYLLPYANLNEKREDWRPEFSKKFAPLVAGAKTPGEAAVILNNAIFDELNVHYHPTKRPKPDQAPSESQAAGFASCTGLSILLVDACRSVGVPARVVGTPSWVVHNTDANGNHGGNHTWVEVWDGQWKVLGASEKTSLNDVWFLANASNAVKKADDPEHKIYAVTPGEPTVYFPLVWDPSIRYVTAEDVTKAYADRTSVAVKVASPTGQPAAAHVTLRQDGRLVADLEVDGSTPVVLSKGQTYQFEMKGSNAAAGGEVTVPKTDDPSVTLQFPRPR